LAVPTEAEIRAVFGVVIAANIEPWKEQVTEGALVTTVPTAGRVVSEKTITAHNITDWTLSNGVRVLVKPTDFNADQILVSAFSPGGASLVSDADVFKTSLAPSIIAAGGVGNFSAIDLRKKLTGKVANALPSIADLSEGMNGSASPKDLETLMQLLYLRFTAPRADSTVFAAQMQQFEQFLKNKDANPMAVFSDTIQQTLANGHPRARPLSAALLKELDLNDMLRIYKDRFGDAGDFTFFFVGNVDLATLKPLVEQWLGSLPAAGRKEAPRDAGPKQFAGVIDKTVRKGIAPQSQSVVLLAGAAPWGREDAYLLDSMGELLQMRLLDRLRESLGGTYSVSVSSAFSRRLRQEWQIAIQYGSAPEKADSLFAAVRNEIAKLRTAPPTAAEVERVKEQQRREFEVELKQNGYWLSSMRSRVENGDPLETLGDYLTLINGLSAEKLAATAKTFLSEENRARFVLLPESSK
jgi:zinc protease